MLNCCWLQRTRQLICPGFLPVNAENSLFHLLLQMTNRDKQAQDSREAGQRNILWRPNVSSLQNQTKLYRQNQHTMIHTVLNA